MAHTGEKPLDPLTLELYRPEGEGTAVIYDEDQPDIPVNYTRQASSLSVEVGPSPGTVDVLLYGLVATEASLDGQPLPLSATPGGQQVRFDGTAGARIEFQID
jgi:hypothetical protein